MTVFFALAAIPILLPWILRAKWPHDISWLEMGASMLLSAVIVGGIYFGGLYSQTYDEEVWSGQVTAKEKDRVGCRHSYSCNCTTDSKGSMSCDTCYEHSHDFDWNVHTNIDETITIRTIDRQGLQEPPRWTQVQLGDPVSKTESFTNYIKAAPDSLFHKHDVKGFDHLIPTYPLEIYDYYKINRVLSAGVPVPDTASWNVSLSLLERRLGPQKQANVVILFVNTADRNYMQALESKWLGGKKNDIVVVIGSTAYPKIDWADVMSWTDKADFKVMLRDELQKQGTVDRVAMLTAIDSLTMSHFKRKDMKDFEYLKYQIEPPIWVLTLAFIFGMIASLLSSLYFYRNDPFGSGGSSYRSRSRFRY